ncbi:Clavaminate synthase-like protein [Dioscorea alata]|uniref:Clavaminate synthase-like protein n=1 Tax=Dioscorea alata TaxID=55571 RepID=A0ACB7W7A5_DIOAL|nr:Clavaminate synthase-like protein [Dioscorea alata]
MEPQWSDRRLDALGDFRVLPDEILCSITDLLSPSDLGRLSCVSSVMYVLCNEEPLWMNLSLKAGGVIKYKGSWKKTVLFQQNLCTEFEDFCSKPLQFDGFYSLFLHRRWYRRFTTLGAFESDSGVIERKKDLTLEEFHSNYDMKKPVLLTELANTWPARNKWTIDQLLSNYGDVAFRISQRSSKKIKMTFEDYVSYMKVQHDEDPLYIFDDKFGEAAPTLLEEYSVPHLFREDLFDVLDYDQRPSFRWLIIGPERSGASWHVDPGLTSAWNTLLCGRKRWALYPPGRVPAGVIVHVNDEDGDVNIETPTSLQWWLDVYPLLADHDKPIECTQLPGETIFVPSGWWHCVLNLETTVAVTQNFVNTSNFEFVCLDMAPGHTQKGVCRAGLLAVQDKGFGDVENDALFESNQLNYPDLTRKEKRLKCSAVDREASRPDNSNGMKAFSDVSKIMQNQKFSYDIEFLSMFLDEDRNQYCSPWSPSNCIGQREMRQWLHKLWVLRPEMRQLIWKGACLALNADKWLTCVSQICSSHKLPFPSVDEKLPVGTGSNPVFLISDFVIKIYVEGGLGNSMHGLGTELEFYDLLQKTESPLISHVPDVIASGIIVYENGSYRVFPWSGKEIPDVIANCNLVEGDGTEDGFFFGVWNKKRFELKNQGNIPSFASIWPFLITRRCAGNIFANLRDILTRDDVLQLASFLGEKLQTLHNLPLPYYSQHDHCLEDKSVTLRKNDLKKTCLEVNGKHSAIPPEWELVLASLEKKKEGISKCLMQWGGPIPISLIEKVEEYIPHDLAPLLGIFKDNEGLYKLSRYPTWIHSDIMDDNVYMEPSSSAHSFDKITSHASSTPSDAVEFCNGNEKPRRWHPTYILDYSDLSLGDPLYDLIPIYVDIFRGDRFLLKQFLKSYKLPFTITAAGGFLSGNAAEDWKKFERMSYRAMCFCILHDENVLGSIFSLWEELKAAKSWEEVEEAVWGELNNY